MILLGTGESYAAAREPATGGGRWAVPGRLPGHRPRPPGGSPRQLGHPPVHGRLSGSPRW